MQKVNAVEEADDGWAGFLQDIRGDLRSIRTPRLARRVKAEIRQVIDSVLHEEENPTNSYPHYQIPVNPTTRVQVSSPGEFISSYTPYSVNSVSSWSTHPRTCRVA